VSIFASGMDPVVFYHRNIISNVVGIAW